MTNDDSQTGPKWLHTRSSAVFRNTALASQSVWRPRTAAKYDAHYPIGPFPKFRPAVSSAFKVSFAFDSDRRSKVFEIPLADSCHTAMELK